MKHFEDAKNLYQEAIDLEASDPENYYSIGVIDWTQAYAPRMKVRAKLVLKPDEVLLIDFSWMLGSARFEPANNRGWHGHARQGD